MMYAVQCTLYAGAGAGAGAGVGASDVWCGVVGAAGAAGAAGAGLRARGLLEGEGALRLEGGVAAQLPGPETAIFGG
jgi:hypothetical protein